MVETLYGLLGNPALHSKSPVIQNAAMRATGQSGYYLPFEVAPSDLEKAVSGLRALQVGGFNVTMPFKQAIIPFLDGIDPMAEKLQAVNTVKNENGRLVGYSTDGAGFWTSLLHHPKQVILIGTGGAARAILAAVPADVTLQIFNRESSRFEQHAQVIKRLSGLDLQPLSTIQGAMQTADLVINATNVGMQGDDTLLTTADFRLMPSGGQVVDIIYRQSKTPFLREAEAANCMITNGLDMLIGQGALSFEIWFGQKAPFDIMKQAIQQ